MHELAHSIEHLSRGGGFPDQSGELVREIIDTGEAVTLAAYSINPGKLTRSQHGAEFVRIALHLHERTRYLACALAAADLRFLSDSYALPESSYGAAVAALGDELAETRNLNLLHLPNAPAGFLGLFS